MSRTMHIIPLHLCTRCLAGAWASSHMQIHCNSHVTDGEMGWGADLRVNSLATTVGISKWALTDSQVPSTKESASVADSQGSVMGNANRNQLDR